MKNFISNIRLPWLIFTLLVFSGLVKLGLWQSDRALQKEQRIETITQLSQTQALSLSQVLSEKNEINDLPITMFGEFDNNTIFLLDNQTNKGQLGYRVYQVFKSDEQAVLVNLGWVVGSINRQEIPDVQAIIGKYQLSGHVRKIEQGIMLMEQVLVKGKWPLRVQQIELDKFSTLISRQLLPFVVYLDKTESVGYEKNWQPIVMPPEKHRAYAFQWFSLAIAWLLLMIWASIKLGRNSE
ncbi:MULTISPECIES: SURF1 family protein [unclassified Colwellia]|uniref:SURF1 family protein n=1 Tax=unclassified Colwellia TaxID=196834 RepID=UPI0015F43EB3|nr:MULTISPECIES: SURF1 family protein [unclassified Colwellia]MBA6231096.1 SURF1 family protein [Colwellia sp. MB02u-7]MBA6235136.1 SURF1 family protein [Colwellia sp. MB02u-11]MBA6257477.1 SURF1 family protein [Colwellia sp. MB3u-28]MBA6260549.1 SURF1 family protein [Colwellia sp. MB3u-41]MBA6301655.1 SURF1 family protein [Colwellia sp. MB3u-22]